MQNRSYLEEHDGPIPVIAARGDDDLWILSHRDLDEEVHTPCPDLECALKFWYRTEIVETDDGTATLWGDVNQQILDTIDVRVLIDHLDPDD